MDIVQIPAIEDNYIYFLHDEKADYTAVIDPGEARVVGKFLQSKSWKLDAIFCTHHHPDHINGIEALVELYDCPVTASSWDHENGHNKFVTHPVADGDSVKIGSEEFRVIGTPGHTYGHIVYHSQKLQVLFAGDFLFTLGCGRVFTNDYKTMLESFRKLRPLPKETKVYCAHEYTAENLRFAESLGSFCDGQDLYFDCLRKKIDKHIPTTPSLLGNEFKYNPFFQWDNLDVRKRSGDVIDELGLFTWIRQQKDQF